MLAAASPPRSLSLSHSLSPSGSTRNRGYGEPRLRGGRGGHYLRGEKRNEPHDFRRGGENRWEYRGSVDASFRRFIDTSLNIDAIIRYVFGRKARNCWPRTVANVARWEFHKWIAGFYTFVRGWKVDERTDIIYIKIYKLLYLCI